MTLISRFFIPRVVRAGVPIRIPDVTNGLLVSKGTVFLFTVIPARSRASSAALPVIFLFDQSTHIKWVSVPPLTILKPAETKHSDRYLAFERTCF